MSTEEFLDTYDELGRPLGVLRRDEVHHRGLWHPVFHLLIVAKRKGVPTVVLQERAGSKKVFPNMLDLTATGHLQAGETPTDGLRELEEELGVTIEANQLVPLGVRRLVDETPEGMNREFVHVFLARDERPLEQYSPTPGEVEAVVEASVAEVLAIFSGDLDLAKVVRIDHAGNRSAPVIDAGDFVPDNPTVANAGVAWGYWRTVLIMAQRHLNGERYLSI